MPDQPQDSQIPREPVTDTRQPEKLPQPKKLRRKLWIIGGSAVLVIVLSGAAFLAGNLMNGIQTGQNGLFAGLLSGNGGGNVQVEEISHPDVIPAPELPTFQPEVRGIFVSRSGSSFTIGTGSFGLTHTSDGSTQPFHDGPTYEVVVTKNTQLFMDTTASDPGSTGPIQQTVAPGTLDDLNPTTELSVWGKKSGDRYVADVILYTQPQIKLNGGSGGTHK